MRCIFLIVIILPVLLRCATAQHDDLPQSDKADPQEQAANDAWAKALWLSIPANDASAEEITAVFTNALMQAEKKAPIYVSFGDADSGPWRFRQMFDDVLETVEQEIAEELEQDLTTKLPDLNLSDDIAVRDALEQTIERSYRKAAQNEETWTKVEALTDTLKDGTDSSIAYYLAALAEDPDYLPAWFRLAKYGEGDVFDKAIKGFMAVDPDNALPWYMLAANQVEADKIDAALQSLQQGNEKPNCRWYPAPMPKRFRLEYPNDEAFQKYGLVGQQMPYESLLFCIDQYKQLFDWADPLPKALRNMGIDFFEKAEQLEEQGKTQDAVVMIEAVRQMGLRLISITPCDGNFMVSGLNVAHTRRQELLRKAYQSQDATEKLADLERVSRQLDSFREEFLKALETSKMTEEKLKLVLIGELNSVEATRVRLHKALVKSGIGQVQTHSPEHTRSDPDN